MLVNVNSMEVVKKYIALGEVLIIDFYASWCPPCKALSPILNALQDQCNILKVNSDDYPEITSHFEVTGLPTLLFFKAGQQVDKVVGLVNKEALEAKIARLKA